jgi:hypothetical protein
MDGEMRNLQPVTKAAQRVVSAVSYLSIDPQHDTFKITGSSGVISRHVRKSDGEVISLRVRARGSFRELTTFDANELSVPERRRLERDMYKDGLSQSAIADLLGLSQATVSLDLKRIGKP